MCMRARAVDPEGSKQAACHGDSGGPLVVWDYLQVCVCVVRVLWLQGLAPRARAYTHTRPSPSSSQPYQVGILSQGSGFCGEFLNATAPDVYMRVSHFLPWIHNVTTAH